MVLWIDNEPADYEDARYIARQHRGKSAMIIGEALRDWYRERLESFDQWPKARSVSDLLSAAWSEVDWREIGEHWLADTEEEEEEEEEETAEE